jgi:hypothetical protein
LQLPVYGELEACWVAVDAELVANTQPVLEVLELPVLEVALVAWLELVVLVVYAGLELVAEPVAMATPVPPAIAMRVRAAPPTMRRRIRRDLPSAITPSGSFDANWTWSMCSSMSVFSHWPSCSCMAVQTPLIAKSRSVG